LVGHESLSYEFGACRNCNRNIDLWHAPQYQKTVDGAYICTPCVKTMDDSVFPLDAHFKDRLEPYIKWRCQQAVNEAMKEVVKKYLEGVHEA
jgi:hypothetical protein